MHSIKEKPRIQPENENKIKIKTSNDKILLTQLNNSLDTAEEKFSQEENMVNFLWDICCVCAVYGRTAGNNAKMGSSSFLRSG